MDAGWRALAQVWGVADPGADPCTQLAAQGLACHSASGLSADTLRQLGRPSLLTLRPQDGPAYPVLLVGLNADTAWLRHGNQAQAVPWSVLAAQWQGDFATLWSPPAGFAPALKDGTQGPTVQRLVDLLTRLKGSAPAGVDPRAPVLGPVLRMHVQAFQRDHGLEPDGRPGVLTFMRLEQALGELRPALFTQPPKL